MKDVNAERVLVTGASGFIGSALVRDLVRRGVPVIAAERRPPPNLCSELGIPVYVCDLPNILPPMEGVRTVVHCATPNDIVSRASDGGLPLAVMGTRALLEHAMAHSVTRFLYLSTLQVYGTELSGPINEETPPRCETMYGLNHYLGEEICRFYARTAGIDSVVLRPSNVYGIPAGPKVDRWTLVPMCFVREAVASNAITLRSSGRQFRNFVSTREVVELICHLLEDFPTGYGIVNAASDWYASVADIAGMVAEAWEREFGRRLPVHVLSDEPARGDVFSILSQRSHLRPTPETSRQRMMDVVNELVRTSRSK